MSKFLFFILIAGTLVACRKETQTIEGLKEQLVGKWTYGTLFQNQYDAKGKLLSSERLPARNDVDYIEFKDNNTFVLTSNGNTETTSGIYDVTSTTKFTLKTPSFTNTCRITSLTYNNLIFEQEVPKAVNQPYTEYTHTLNR